MLVDTPNNEIYSLPSFSIFSPEPLEKVDDAEESDKPDSFDRPRPPSPLVEVIQHPPKLYEDFLEILQERIKPDPLCKKLSIEQQEGLICIIFSEVYSCWNSLCEAVNDPHLKNHQNRKVHVLLFINVVEICQDLFDTYLNKMDKLNSKGVFSRSANISRIKGSLIAEANKSLNVHRLRQRILRDFKLFNNATPMARKSAGDKEHHRENFLRHFDALVSKTSSMMFNSDLTKKISVLESKLQSSHASTDAPLISAVAGAVSEGKSVPDGPSRLLSQHDPSPSRHLSQPSPQGDSPKTEDLSVVQGDSLSFRHKDLEFLLSEHRIPQNTIVDDEEELSAVLQAQTKAVPPKRPRLKPSRSRLLSRVSDEVLDVSDLPIQPAIKSNTMPDKSIVRTSDIRVSERIPQYNMILELSPCIYNELKNEIDETNIAFLDRNLFMGQEIRDVYSEIYKTIDHLHVKFTSKMEAPCKNLPAVDRCRYFNSGIMRKKNYKDRRVNETIKVVDRPPWEDGAREEWEAAVHFQGNDSHGSVSDVFPSQLIKVPVFSDWDTNNFGNAKESKGSREGKSYTNWLQWWKSIMSVDDYQKYLSLRESDYLALIFHLYDSEEEVDSDDERDLILEQEMAKEREKRDKVMQAMLEEKNKFENGMWNANAVMMGGLGKDPELEEESVCASGEITPVRSVLAVPKRSPRSTSAVSACTSVRKSISSKQTNTMTLANTLSMEASSTIAPALEIKLLQERLDNIWGKLEMPDDTKIDMTIKYCKYETKQLKSTVDLWENACTAISNREKLILELEIFEKDASDPQRLFGKNPKTSRLVEEKRRSALHRRIKKCEKEVLSHVGKVKDALGDVVTYQGRVYFDKMSRDITEMLYWLQQERRQVALEKGGMLMVDLPPVSPLQLIG